MKTITLTVYANKRTKPEQGTFEVLTVDQVKAWAVPVSKPCTNCDHGKLSLTFQSADHVARFNTMYATAHSVGDTIQIDCGGCGGSQTRLVDTTPSHVWFVTINGDARQAKVNGKVRTWKRDTGRVELPVKYGLYEYATFDTSDIESGRLLRRIS